MYELRGRPLTSWWTYSGGLTPLTSSGPPPTNCRPLWTPPIADWTNARTTEAVSVDGHQSTAGTARPGVNVERAADADRVQRHAARPLGGPGEPRWIGTAGSLVLRGSPGPPVNAIYASLGR